MNGILKMYAEVKGKRPTLFKNFLLAKAILFVIILVLGTNWLNKRHLSMVQSTMDSVHDDKRAVQHYIYRLNHQFHLKQLQLNTNGISPHVFKESTSIEQVLTDIGALKLTPKESLYFDDLKIKYLKLLDLEESTLNGTGEILKKKHLKMKLALDRIMVVMDDLAKISFAERLVLSEKEKKALNMDKLLLKIEIASFMVIGIIVQLIILYPGKGE